MDSTIKVTKAGGGVTALHWKLELVSLSILEIGPVATNTAQTNVAACISI